MALNEKLAGRIRESLAGHEDVEEKKMFGGLCFMVNGKMCVCAKTEEMMCRIDPEIFESVLKKKKARPMIHNGNLMKGFLFISEEDLKTKKEFEYWIKLSLEYNKVSKPAKAKSKEKGNPTARAGVKKRLLVERSIKQMGDFLSSIQ
ncbi:TfoX family protein [Leptospira sarikeiensis]|uniref:TfoX family protein n=2 Tax=Leptospira sarikeiensis TaxID=2484943 RepID=A0A4R9K6D3_9LEPT|nr:TfoX family protein [Leptospira sarikeiensis]